MTDGGSSHIEISSTPINRQNRNIGFVVGFCCLLIPFICALHYVRKLHVAVSTHAAATSLGSLIIFASGGTLLRKNRFDFNKEHTESKAVKIMVSEKGYSCCSKGSQTWIVREYCSKVYDITFENLILICGTEHSNHILPFKFTEQMSRNTAWMVVLKKCNFRKTAKVQNRYVDPRKGNP